jgi:hypothetical protein
MFCHHFRKGEMPMTLSVKSMVFVLTGILVIAIAVALPLLPAFGEGGAGTPRSEIVQLANPDRTGSAYLIRGRSEWLLRVATMNHAGTQMRKPQSGLMPDWGFLVTLSLFPATASG